MGSKVALVEFNGDVYNSFERALQLLGTIDDLNTTERSVVIKPGVFTHKKQNHPTVSVVSAIVQSFNNAPQLFLVESDNYRGKGLERLQLWQEVFTNRVMPFNLSDDQNTREIQIGNETIKFSHLLFKPNVFVSTHTLRKYKEGTILKNLLGLIPDRKKARFHKNLVNVLLDAYEAIGGIDLAVLDGTYTYSDPSSDKKRIATNVILVGRDAIAVEAVGADFVGLNPAKMPLIQKAMARGLGEGDIHKIKVFGDPVERLKEKLQ